MEKMKKNVEDYEYCGSCGCCGLLLLINITIGGLCSDYMLGYWFGLNIHWFWDCLIGVIGGEFIIPLALITLILQYGVGLANPVFPVTVQQAALGMANMLWAMIAFPVRLIKG